MLAQENPYIEKAYEHLTRLSADEIKRLEYEAREKAIRDYNHQMHSNFRQGLEQGIKAFIEACQELAHSQDVSRDFLVKKFSLSTDKAQAYLDKYWV